VVSEALDVLTELLSRFGGLVPTEHARIKECTLGYLGDVKVMLRKRAMSCLGEITQITQLCALLNVKTYIDIIPLIQIFVCIYCNRSC
jgi:hypothetical protein